LPFLQISRYRTASAQGMVIVNSQCIFAKSGQLIPLMRALSCSSQILVMAFSVLYFSLDLCSMYTFVEYLDQHGDLAKSLCGPEFFSASRRPATAHRSTYVPFCQRFGWPSDFCIVPDLQCRDIRRHKLQRYWACRDISVSPSDTFNGTSGACT
jgi:hypothetical protein